MEPRWTCSFCGQAATLEPAAGLRVCRACATRIAELVAESAPESLADIWSSAAPPAGPAEERATVPRDIDSERVFDEFKRGVAKQISADDAETHWHLAEAYRAMGLYLDARREAAVALSAAAAVSIVEGALRILLTPPMLEPDGLVRLRRRLRGAAS